MPGESAISEHMPTMWSEHDLRRLIREEMARPCQPKSERDEGFYWVRCEGEWIVAEWKSATWRRCGVALYFHSVAEIGERITRDSMSPSDSPSDRDALGEAVSLIAALLDALDGNYNDGTALVRLKANADKFRCSHWESRNEWWDKKK